MCYNPITIINPTKYVSLRYRDRYLLQVPCGKCAACMTNKSNEWYFRLYHQALACYKDNGFVYFDTLTYNNAFLPHISDYIGVPNSIDFPCFSTEHIRLFVAALRQYCKRKLHCNFEFFIVSEYGTSEKHLHRPHYHVLFFVHGLVSPLDFSFAVSKYWFYGRTDGNPYRSTYHVLHNTFLQNSDGSIRSIKYICKYIQKSCKFQHEIDKRINIVLNGIAKKFEDQGLDWRESSHYWRVRDILHRRFNQFHRQSTKLGISALDNIDIGSVFETGSLNVPDKDNVIMRLPLPTYYKRKLFYQQIKIDNALTWQPTELGIQYLEYRLSVCVSSLSARFKAISAHIHQSFDTLKLADYVLNYRGRFSAQFPSEWNERLANVDFYNYSTRFDREALGSLGLAYKWCGNSSTRYQKCCSFVRFTDFIKKYVYLNDDYEKQLDLIYSYTGKVDTLRQQAYEVKQRLQNLYHHLLV